MTGLARSSISPVLSIEARTRAKLTQAELAERMKTTQYGWKDEFPRVAEASPALKERVRAKWPHLYA